MMAQEIGAPEAQKGSIMEPSNPMLWRQWFLKLGAMASRWLPTARRPPPPTPTPKTTATPVTPRESDQQGSSEL